MGARRGYNERIAELKRRREELLQQEKRCWPARSSRKERTRRIAGFALDAKSRPPSDMTSKMKIWI